MTAKEKLEANEKKIQIYNSMCGICEVCGKIIPFSDSQLAHRIPKTKMYLKKYGKKIIHHRMNLALVCGLECNSKVNVGNNPMSVEYIVKRIGDTLSN